LQYEVIDRSESPEKRVIGRLRHLVDAIVVSEALMARLRHPIVVHDRKSGGFHYSFNGIWVYKNKDDIHSPLWEVRRPRLGGEVCRPRSGGEEKGR